MNSAGTGLFPVFLDSGYGMSVAMDPLLIAKPTNKRDGAENV